MNVIEQNLQFEKQYASKCSSIFEAINMWANDANKINDKYRGRLEPCECLETALTGELPDDFLVICDVNSLTYRLHRIKPENRPRHAREHSFSLAGLAEGRRRGRLE